jgi:hypothetical protein
LGELLRKLGKKGEGFAGIVKVGHGLMALQELLLSNLERPFIETATFPEFRLAPLLVLEHRHKELLDGALVLFVEVLGRIENLEHLLERNALSFGVLHTGLKFGEVWLARDVGAGLV